MPILRLDPDDRQHVAVFREVRLRALETDPEAFGSDLAAARSLGDDAWRSRLAGYREHPGAVFGAPPAATTTPHDRPPPLLGMVGVGLPRPADAMIWGLWVAPEGRRRGLAAELVGAAETWAIDAGADRAALWVHRSNLAAQGLYERLGYTLTGPDEQGLDAPDECSDEIGMHRRLRPDRSSAT